LVQSHAKQIVYETLSQKNPSQKRASGVVQGEGPEFKPQYQKKKKKERKKKGVGRGRKRGEEGRGGKGREREPIKAGRLAIF
jgi:hypothetical protein